MSKQTSFGVKEQFAEAKVLIQAKRYAEARALLRAIDHPTATEWLRKLDKIAPEATPKATMPLKRRVFLTLVGLVGLLLVCVLILAMPQLRRNTPPSASAPTARATLAAAARATTASTVTAAATATASATITETATTAATVTASATITETAMQAVVATLPLQVGGSPFGCNQIDDLNCSDFAAIGQNANAHLAQCGDEDKLDQDGDGRACEDQTGGSIVISTPAAAFDEAEYIRLLSDGLFLSAGGRNIESIRVADGRANGGERAVIVSYTTTESTDAGYIEEWVDLFQGIAVTIRAHDLDVDSVSLVAGTATGQAAGILVSSINDLIAFSEGRITQTEFFNRMTITTF